MRLTEDQTKKELDQVAKFADNAEKLAWRRKLKKMESYIEDEARPLEDKILALYREKLPIMDKIEKLRQVMVDECIHPKEYLIHKGTHIECKFCGKSIKPKR